MLPKWATIFFSGNQRSLTQLTHPSLISIKFLCIIQLVLVLNIAAHTAPGVIQSCGRSRNMDLKSHSSSEILILIIQTNSWQSLVVFKWLGGGGRGVISNPNHGCVSGMCNLILHIYFLSIMQICWTSIFNQLERVGQQSFSLMSSNFRENIYSHETCQKLNHLTLHFSIKHFSTYWRQNTDFSCLTKYYFRWLGRNIIPPPPFFPPKVKFTWITWMQTFTLHHVNKSHIT